MGRKRILVVDDDLDDLETTRIILEAEGHDVAVMSTGDECMEYVRTTRPDLVILDVMLDTKLEGFRLSVEIRKTPGTETVPIIVMSAVYEDLPDLPTPEECGLDVSAFLKKPVEPKQLVAAVKEALGE